MRKSPYPGIGRIIHFTFIVVAIIFGTCDLKAQTAAEDTIILIQNATIFDGKNERLTTGDVLIYGDKIHRISNSITAPDGAKVVDATGLTLMPGMIDAHWHTMLSGMPLVQFLTSAEGYINLVAADGAKNTLMRGFTTVRDVGGNSFSIKAASDQGLIAGPRIYPSGPMIGQTSGHSDARGAVDVPSEVDAALPVASRNGHFLVADGVPEVLKRTREALRMGASQIKIMAGGGTSSQFDPIDSRQYTLDEIKAAVDAAKSWNTYVGVHAYTAEAIKQAIEAGVQVLEHGQMIDEEAIKLIKENDIWLNLQPFTLDAGLEPLSSDPVVAAKQKIMEQGTDQAYQLAIKYGVKIAWGTDLLFSPEYTKNQGKGVAYMKRWFSPFEVLKMVTHDNAQLAKLSGKRDPYPDAALGVIEEGAYADMILVKGNPMDNLDLVADPETNFVMIMKAGKIYKNTINP